MALTVDSSNPIIITENEVEKTYDKWVVNGCAVGLAGDEVSLSLQFSRCRIVDGLVELCPLGAVNYSIDDILTDADVATASGTFFTSLITKVMTAGVIS